MPHIAEAVKRNPAIIRSPFHEQFQTLVIDPLRHRQGRVILVFDAIDECKSARQRKDLLDTLAVAVRESENLRIFITSRPDPVIETVLQPLSIKTELRDRLHDVKHRENIDDIATYVHRSLEGVLSKDRRQQLVERAKGLFIWASTACRMLKDEATLNTPESIFDGLISAGQNGAIDDVYDLVFERIDPGSHTTLCSMLALLLAVFEPLTTDDLDDLLKQVGVYGSAKALVRNLGSVLTEDQMTKMIQFRHPTLVEYLRRRCINPSTDNSRRIYLDIAEAHGRAASWCLKCLKSLLKFNICEIESSFSLNSQIPDLAERISKCVPLRLQYASSHWLFHVAEIDVDQRHTLKNELRYVIRSPYVLYWMEILSVIGRVPRVIAGLRAVTRHAGVSGVFQDF